MNECCNAHNLLIIHNSKVAHHLPSVNVIADEMVQRLQALRDTRWDKVVMICRRKTRLCGNQLLTFLDFQRAGGRP